MNENNDNPTTDNSQKNSATTWWRLFTADFRARFNITEDSAPQAEVIEAISKGVPFRGATLWILIFATILASVGLNVNSIGPIIGAMLVSPLMGPILGFGLSLAINDFELMKKSMRNFGYMTLTAIVTATLYFLLTPIGTAQSELLARTTPTFYDVLIAFFGGAAGVVGYTRKERALYVITGVAIATALLPPLCTAGYGIATLSWKFFGGALYLFSINAIFIAVSTYVCIRILKYKKKSFVEPRTERRVKRLMWCIIVIAILPSIFIAFRLINQSVFESNADRFVKSEFQFEETRVLETECEYLLDTRKKHRTISVVLYGEPLSDDAIENIRRKMPAYDLTHTDLMVKQSSGNTQIDFTPLQIGYAQILDEKNRQIKKLEQQLTLTKSVDSIATRDMVREFGAIVAGIESVSLSHHPVYSPGGVITDTLFVCIINPVTALTADDMERMERWLKVKGRTENVKIYVEQQ
jgi:uncharacterized hydrophobic protein (TIGR00271 family)